jgi:hypothetical protein
MWKWDSTQDNKWARVAKCSQLLIIPIEMPGAPEERRGTSWAKATRELRRLRHRIEAVGGSKDQWEAGVWHMEKEQWDLLWTGEQAFWKAVPHLLVAGHHTAEELAEPRRPSNGRPYKIPRLMAAQEGERTQLILILLSRGIGGINDRTRGLTEWWFDMVDWRSAHVSNTRLGVSQSIEGYTKTLEGEVHLQHPARTWVDRQEQKSRGHESEQIQTTSECEHHLLQDHTHKTKVAPDTGPFAHAHSPGSREWSAHTQKSQLPCTGSHTGGVSALTPYGGHPSAHDSRGPG